NRIRLQFGLCQGLHGATLLQQGDGECAMRQSRLGIEIERRAKLRDRVIEAPVVRVTHSERAPGGRAQWIERNRLLPEFDRLVVAAEDEGEARTRDEHGDVAGGASEGA